MNAKIKYTDEPLGKVEVIADMLPSPEELAFKEDTVKVTASWMLIHTPRIGT